MNINLLNAVNALKAKEGEGLFDNPGALEQLLETARDEPRAQIKTLVTACVRDFHKEVQAAAVTERAACKERLAQKLHDDEGLDLTLCKNTLDLIEAALFGAASGSGSPKKADKDAPKPQRGLNLNLLNAVYNITAKHGKDVFDKPNELERPLFEAAGAEPRFQLKTLLICCGKGCPGELRAAAETERAACKERLAQKLHDDEGLDLTLCGNTLDLIEAALFSDIEKTAETYLASAEKYMQKKDHAGAIAEYTKAIQINPKNAEAFGRRGEVYLFQKAYDSAIPDLNKAIELDSGSYSNYINRGNVYYAKGNYNAALSDLDKAAELNADGRDIYYLRGALYNEQGNYDEAIKNLTKYRELNPEHTASMSPLGQAYYGRGFANFNSRKYAAAIKDFNKAIEFEPNNADTYFWQGRSYIGTENWDAAIQSFSLCIKRSQKNYRNYHWRGRAYFNKADYDAALNDFKKAYDLNNRDIESIFWQGRVHMEQKNWRSAINWFKWATESKDSNYKYYEWLGRAHLENQNYWSAINDLNAAIELYSRQKNTSKAELAALHYFRGMAYFPYNGKEAARDDLNKAVELDPGNEEYQENLKKAKSGCFITSAVCRSFAKPDDCYELSLFRQFRDGWLTEQPEGPALIERYYRCAPSIVAVIDRSPAPDAVYRRIWDEHLAPCLRSIENGILEDCKARYIRMVEILEKEWEHEIRRNHERQST